MGIWGKRGNVKTDMTAIEKQQALIAANEAANRAAERARDAHANYSRSDGDAYLMALADYADVQMFRTAIIADRIGDGLLDCEATIDSILSRALNGDL
jgi:hypothetical protein